MTPSKSQVGELVERLAAAIHVGIMTGAATSHPTNIYNLADQAATALRAQEERIAALEGEVERVKGEWDEIKRLTAETQLFRRPDEDPARFAQLVHAAALRHAIELVAEKRSDP